jgi:aromatic-L-amino-acid decarboxylase
MPTPTPEPLAPPTSPADPASPVPGAPTEEIPLGDIPIAVFRRHGHTVIDRVATYLADPGAYPVLPMVKPGDVRGALPPHPPQAPEPMEAILADLETIVLPATTHWNHPGFFAYFAISGSAPGVLAETLAAALNVNAMLWRTGPAATELEQVTLDWLRQLLGLPAGLFGIMTEGASLSTLCALAAAREALDDLHVRDEGLSGRPDLPLLRVYASEEAHSSVDKAAITLGLGRRGIRHISTDEHGRMDVSALEQAIREDRAAGIRPIAVVATVGTTSTSAIDPVSAIAALCARERIWLHVDASYGGAAAVVPEMWHVLAGCEQADSLVVNPHKWLFVPVDCSALYVRRPDILKRAFSLVPEYLTTSEAEEAPNLMDYGVALGRRFRALKLWFVLRAFGAEGLADRIREHLRLARLFASWVEDSPDFELLADVPFSLVVFRHHPAGSDDARLDAHNAALLEGLNATGEVYLSHTRVKGRYALRLAVGNLRTRESHVRRAWELVCAIGRNARGTTP